MRKLALTLCLVGVAAISVPAHAQDSPALPPNTDWAEPYLADLLREAARANRGRRLNRLVKRGSLSVGLPRSDLGTLSVRLSLLPDPPGPPVRLARGTAEPADGLRRLRLVLRKRARRRLARLYVAALELDASFVPAGREEPIYDRVVFLVRR